mgnify:CR=1 FL=1
MTAATGAAAGVGSLLVVRFLFGVGEAGCFPSMARAYSRWLPARERGRAFGLALMTAALWAVPLTQPLVVRCSSCVHWRHTFMHLRRRRDGLGRWRGTWWFRDDPHGHGGGQRRRAGASSAASCRRCRIAVCRGVAAALTATSIALCGMYGFAIYGWYFYITWLPTYLLRARGFATSRRSAGSSALPLLEHRGWRAGRRLGSATSWRGAGAARVGRRTPGADRPAAGCAPRSSARSVTRCRRRRRCSSPLRPAWPRSASARAGRCA